MGLLYCKADFDRILTGGRIGCRSTFENEVDQINYVCQIGITTGVVGIAQTKRIRCRSAFENIINQRDYIRQINRTVIVDVPSFEQADFDLSGFTSVHQAVIPVGAVRGKLIRKSVVGMHNPGIKKPGGIAGYRMAVGLGG